MQPWLSPAPADRLADHSTIQLRIHVRTYRGPGLESVSKMANRGLLLRFCAQPCGLLPVLRAQRFLQERLSVFAVVEHAGNRLLEVRWYFATDDPNPVFPFWVCVGVSMGIGGPPRRAARAEGAPRTPRAAGGTSRVKKRR